jgi:hypothetical protein
LPTITDADQSEPTIRDVLVAVDGLRTEVGGLRTDVGGLRTEVGGLRTEVGGLRADVGGLRTEVGGLRTEVGGLRMDVGGLRTEVGGLRTEVGVLGDRMDGFERELGALTEFTQTQFAHLTTEIVGVKDDVSRLSSEVKESVRLGRQHRDTLSGIKGDIARLDAKIDFHRDDHEIHLPRPRSADASERGPVAA